MPGTTSLGLAYPLSSEGFTASRQTIEDTTKAVDSALAARSLTNHTHTEFSGAASVAQTAADTLALQWMQVAN